MVVAPLAIVPTVVSSHPRNRTIDLNGFWDRSAALKKARASFLVSSILLVS